MTGYDGRGGRFPLVIVRGADLAFALTVVDDADVAINMSTATIEAEVYDSAGTVAVTMTSTVSGASSNIVTLSLSDTQTAALADTSYSWTMWVTRGADRRPWLAGRVTVTDGDRGRSSNGANQTLVVDTDVNVAVTVNAVGPAAQAASSVSIADAGGYYTGTNVETALAEVGVDIAALPSQYQPLDADLTTLAAGGLPTNLQATLNRQFRKSALYLAGVDQHVTTPDGAAFDITSDICVVVEVSPDNWTPAVSQLLASKWLGSGNQRSWQFGLRTTGALSFTWSADGIATVAAVLSSSNLSALAAGSRRYLAVTFDADNGASGNTLRFWHSLDGAAWTQLGADVVTAGASSIFASTATQSIGSLLTSSFFTGKLHSFSLRNGIGAAGVVGGTEVASFDADISGPSPQRDNYGNVWTPSGTTPLPTPSADPF